MPKVRHLQPKVAVDIRVVKLLAAKRSAYTRHRDDKDSEARYFRNEAERLLGEVAQLLRENVALRRTNEAYAQRIVELEQGR